MRIGAVFPQYEMGQDPADIREWAQTVERLGFDHLLAYDHVLGAGTDTRPGWQGYTSDTLFHEVFVLYGYLAAVTSSIELVTGVVILPQRQTVLVAKQAAQVDVLSGGRLRLGVGIGWNQVEYDGLEIADAFHVRGKRSEEQIEVMRALWAEPLVTFHGRWHDIDNAGILPRPGAGRIPVWIGGHADATLRRIARIGDGWFPNHAPNERTRAALERLRGYIQEAGRDQGDVGIEARLNVSEVPPDGRADHAAAWAALGATHLTVNTMGCGYTTVTEHLRVLEETITALR